ncbi:cupin domain-containing protein [Puniceibacterium sp. IMCC21224]|uniref:cupin domain-containing protein n=1 Tax=Puniceibacterium sp. IMCC21224 TaxID=1618204 RepID=UPI00064D78A6|nr:cupin domain-containing protein [Puniceibacterium sp. IMCC21224]KMK66414.1 cupin domain-containing protein [Puniceibacterium sp. IMCC21224]
MTFPTVPTDPGVTRQVLAETPDLMTVAFRFQDGAVGKLHSHPHVQATYVEAGRFTFHLDGKDHDLGPGDSLIISSNAKHGCLCIESGTLIDTFSPRRDDFL